MNLANLDIATILGMRHSSIHNYGVPGLTSSLIGAPREGEGCIRVFECERTHQEPFTPHSHRYDFTCIVLRGSVINRVWSLDRGGDSFQESVLAYDRTPGKYAQSVGNVNRYRYDDYRYDEGETYRMSSEEIHSIQFSRGTVVLFFEGPKVADSTIILEPFVDGVGIPTFKVEPWMFRKEV